MSGHFMFQKWANVPQMIEEAESDEIMQTRADPANTQENHQTRN